MYYIYRYEYYPNRPNGYVGVTQNINQRHYHHTWENGESFDLPIVLDKTDSKYKAERLEREYKRKYSCEDNRDSYTKTLAMQSRSHSVKANKKRSKSITTIQKGKIRKALYKTVIQRRKPIIQYKKGIPVKIWESASEYADITNGSLVGVWAVLNGKQKTSRGYTFEYL